MNNEKLKFVKCDQEISGQLEKFRIPGNDVHVNFVHYKLKNRQLAIRP
jgi:hypothetical protein